MKPLTLQELNLEDSLWLVFDGAFHHQSGIERELEPLLQTLEACAGDWMPDIVRGKRRRNYSRAAVWKALEERRTAYSAICGLSHTAFPAVSLTIDLGLTQRQPALSIRLNVQPLAFFAEAARCRMIVEMVRAWAARYEPPYAMAHGMADIELSDFPSFGRANEAWKRDGHDRVYEVYWLNVFGPKLVDTIGRERMLSTPAHRVEALPNGCVLLVTWPTAAGCASQEARQAQARALVHLRPDLDFDTVLHTLHERSATLAPVEPHFHEDVAPLLSRVVDACSIGKRQQKIAELNSYHPPEPDEWMPADSAPPPDVEDWEGALRSYAYRAEHLVALLHAQVPSVFEETPESLTAVDLHFWQENFPEVFERKTIDEHAVPAIGAYLGQVLVRRLGGQWIPRQKLEETQVRVGQRSWLPFVRAHRYMRSSKSLLDYSLTQLFREAARHRGSH